MLGYTVEELLRVPVRDLLPPEFHSEFDEYLKTIVQTGEAHGLVAVRTHSGERRVWEYHNKLRTEGGVAPVVHGVAHDVTEQRRIERELRRSPDGFRLLEEYSPALAIFDREMRYLYASHRWRTDYLLGDRDLLGISHYDLFPEIPERWKQFHRRGLAGEVLREENDRFDRADGSTQWIRWEIRPWHQTTGAIGGIAIFAEDLTDITERRRTEEAIRRTEDRYRTLVEATSAVTWSCPPSGLHVKPQPSWMAFTGQTAQEMLGTGWTKTVHPDDIAAASQRWNDAVARGEQFLSEHRIRRHDGQWRWMQAHAVPVRNPGGQVLEWFGMNLDITERKQAEESLRESEERLRLAQEAAQIGTFDRNLLTGKCRWTRQQEAIYGVRAGEFPETIDKFIELVHSDDRPHVSSLVAQSMASGEAHGEWRAVWPDGTIRWISGRWRVFHDSEGKPIRAIGVDYDITERKRIEEELRQAKEKLTEEKLYLEHTIDSELGFQEIIGRSVGLKTVMDLAARVAGCDATVLLLGETGTGKELVARAIHRLSTRAGNAFIKMNCAAIPSGLLESELFGAEKGAYTGSVSRKVGRLELADKGTIFLDEIGEIDLALQPKLLRVLQDQEFERLGGTQTLKVNFRLIAATNRDLAEEVQRNQFRRDLYYRLNVFPIFIPPLRERREDIPLLVEHFVRKFARRMNKPIASVPSKTMAALAAWDWPGNVRELENFIERSVILSTGSVLAVPLTELQARIPIDSGNETLRTAERKHILEALRLSNGRISGENGAAARLGLKRTTLQSKLKQLGIDPRTPPSS